MAETAAVVDHREKEAITAAVAPTVNQCGKWLLLITLAVSLLAGPAFAEVLAAPPAKPAYFVSFLEKTILKVPATRSVEVGDLDGDGCSDLIFVTSDPAVIWVSRGDGKGNFTPPKKVGFSGGYQNAVVGATVLLIDSDDDGRDEIVTFQERRINSESSEASLFLVTSSLGNEFFEERSSLSLPGHLGKTSHPFLFSGNIGGAKKPGLIFGANADELYAIGAGRKPALPFKNGMPRIKTGDLKEKPLQVIALDADNDGLTDIVRVGQKQIAVIRGETNATLVSGGKEKPQLFLSDLNGLSFAPNFSVLHGRFNRDPFVDLFAYDDAGTGWVLLNAEGSKFSMALMIHFPDYQLIDSGDFNGDGFADIVAAGGRAGLKIWLNSGDALFPKTVERPLGGKTVSSLSVLDVNDDGLSDIIVTLRGSFGGLEGRVLLNISQRLGN